MNEQDTLNAAYQAFKKIPFPTDSDDAELSDVHAELVSYDSAVAGIVSTLIQGGDATVENLRADLQLRTRLETLSSGNTDRTTDAQRYLLYLTHIEQLIETARTHLRFAHKE